MTGLYNHLFRPTGPEQLGQSPRIFEHPKMEPTRPR